MPKWWMNGGEKSTRRDVHAIGAAANNVGGLLGKSLADAGTGGEKAREGEEAQGAAAAAAADDSSSPPALLASLAAQELRRITLKDGKVTGQETLFKDLGRIRQVITGPDGAVYVLLPERIARLKPAG